MKVIDWKSNDEALSNFTVALLMTKADATTLLKISGLVTDNTQGSDKWINTVKVEKPLFTDMYFGFVEYGMCDHNFAPTFCGKCGERQMGV